MVEKYHVRILAANETLLQTSNYTPVRLDKGFGVTSYLIIATWSVTYCGLTLGGHYFTLMLLCLMYVRN